MDPRKPETSFTRPPSWFYRPGCPEESGDMGRFDPIPGHGPGQSFSDSLDEQLHRVPSWLQTRMCDAIVRGPCAAVASLAEQAGLTAWQRRPRSRSARRPPKARSGDRVRRATRRSVPRLTGDKGEAACTCTHRTGWNTPRVLRWRLRRTCLQQMRESWPRPGSSPKPSILPSGRSRGQ